MEWPSKRIPQGGMFQPAKIKYSPETQKFLKVLMEESKLTMLQRQKVNYSLRSGDSLPCLTSKKRQEQERQKAERPGESKRRMFNTIVQSGAYNREKFVPEHPKVDRTKTIQRLQDIMFYGKELKKEPRKVKPKKAEEVPVVDRFDELKNDIKERQDWLAEMEKLGQGEKFRLVINQQIAALLREMDQLNCRAKAK